jgi:L-rhamnose mutarotase
MVLRLRPDRAEEYLALHAAVWPGVLDAMRRNGWRDFTIFLREPEMLLVGVFDYVGADFAASARAIAADPETQKWLALCDPCQEPLASRAEGEWWAPMRPIFHMD